MDGELSAFGYPNYIVPLLLAIAEENSPLIVAYVSGAAPAWIVSEDLHNPSSRECVFYFLLNIKSVRVSVRTMDLGCLIDNAENLFLLSVSDA